MGKKGNTMNSNTREVRLRSVWQLSLTAFLLMALLIAGLTGVRAASTNGGFKIVGTVSSAPNTAAGGGLWGVIDDMGHSHTVQADADTEFDNGIPQVGDRVEVVAETGGPQPLAT